MSIVSFPNYIQNIDYNKHRDLQCTADSFPTVLRAEIGESSWSLSCLLPPSLHLSANPIIHIPNLIYLAVPLLHPRKPASFAPSAYPPPTLEAMD